LNRPTIQQNDREGGDKVRTREQIEWSMITLLMQMSDCKKAIKAAEEAQEQLERLRRELGEAAAEYAKALRVEC
jgi:hypothetical protein